MSIQVFTQYLEGIINRDWSLVRPTLSTNVYREGYDGPGDSSEGVDDYMRFLERSMTPLVGFGYDVHRFVTFADDTIALVEVDSRYEEDGETFGYRMALVWHVDDEDLIDRIDVYWKTPARRLRQDQRREPTS